MTERDPLTIRGRILKEFGKVQKQIETHPNDWRKVSFRAHERICEAMGEDYVNYPEFEFWFSRFLQGNFDWGYDRSSDPKPRSFTDLPSDVFNKIGEYLTIEDRLRLRNVCKDIRARVDNWDLEVTKFWYDNAKYWVLYLKSRSKPYCPRSIGKNRDPISFLMNVLKLPNLQLEKLTIREEDVYWKALVRELDESNRKLHVKNVEFPCLSSSEIDLHFMIPGVLEEIKMFFLSPTREEFYDIVESEQSLYNCPRFTLKLIGKPADSLKATFLKRLMKYCKVQKCVIYAERGILNYFNEPEAMVPNFPSLRRYPIPRTNEFYELEYREKLGHRGRSPFKDFIHIERKQ